MIQRLARLVHIKFRYEYHYYIGNRLESIPRLCNISCQQGCVIPHSPLMIIIVGFLYFGIDNSPITQGAFNIQNTGTPLQIFQHKLRNIIHNL